MDLFAGSGGLGLEAISRGASETIFVEQNPKAFQTLNTNIKNLGFENSAKSHKSDAISWLKRCAQNQQQFYWVFLDPPYAGSLLSQALEILGSYPGLTNQGLIVVEYDKRSPPDEDYGSLIKSDSRRYGDTCIAFFPDLKTHWQGHFPVE